MHKYAKCAVRSTVVGIKPSARLGSAQLASRMTTVIAPCVSFLYLILLMQQSYDVKGHDK